ncbi:MAG: virB8 family protein [Caulobacterales bacterium]
MSRDLTRRPDDRDPRDGELTPRDAHYDVTRRWLAHAQADDETTKKTGGWVACVLFVICAAQAAAIALMLPLKETVPYTILVDRQTGYVETVRGLQMGDLPQDVALTQSFLAQYVLARETYDVTDLASRYERVALWSDGEARTSYIDAYRTDNPTSLPKVLAPGTRVDVTVKSIEILSNTSARVRFETRTRPPAGLEERSDYQAVIGFRYSNATMRMEDRLINPLGFQAVSYRRDAETLEPIVIEPEAPETAAQTPNAQPPAPPSAAPPPAVPRPAAPPPTTPPPTTPPPTAPTANPTPQEPSP